MDAQNASTVAWKSRTRTRDSHTAHRPCRFFKKMKERSPVRTDVDHRSRFLRFFTVGNIQARACIPLRALLRLLRLSPRRFHAWRRRHTVCCQRVRTFFQHDAGRPYASSSGPVTQEASRSRIADDRHVSVKVSGPTLSRPRGSCDPPAISPCTLAQTLEGNMPGARQHDPRTCSSGGTGTGTVSLVAHLERAPAF